MWQDLEETHELQDNTSLCYVSVRQFEKQLASSEESNKIEESSKGIENAQANIKAKYTALSSQNNMTKESTLITSHANNSSKNGENNHVNSNITETTEEIPSPLHVKINLRLNPLKVPSLDGGKTGYYLRAS